MIKLFQLAYNEKLEHLQGSMPILLPQKCNELLATSF